LPTARLEIQFVRIPDSFRHRQRTPAALAVLGVLALAGCAGTPERPETGPERDAQAHEDASRIGDPRRRRIVETALGMVGVPYLYGGESPQGFDCSGLVQYSYRSAGISVPRTAREQLRMSTAVALSDLLVGDLLFFESPQNAHVGIYLGDGRFVHAPSSGRKVSIGSLEEPYYKSHFVRAGRLRALTS
jgi:cell wall-associated NlpC family hydrolase